MQRFLYKAVIKKVVDGDTIDLDINLGSLSQLGELLETMPESVDLGFSVHVSLPVAALLFDGQGEIWLRQERLRLSGVNCPECNALDPEPGLAARDYAAKRLPIDSVISLQTIRVRNKTKREKYGRYLGVVVLEDGSNFNRELVDLGFANVFMVNN